MTDLKFTDEEIIKAMDCCAHYEGNYCDECPFLHVDCGQLTKYASNLLNRYKAELEVLRKTENKKLKVLELFAGTRSIGKAFEARGHEVFSVEWDRDFDDIDLYADIMTVTADDVLKKFGRPDVIWASPDCTTFSIAAISHHRRKNPETGNLDPISDYAKFCDAVDQHVLRLIMALSPRYWFIENPRGGMRKMAWMQGLPRYTVTYCQYGDRRMKPTDIWTNHPNPQFKPMCKNGDTCHESAPRGAKTGTQGLKGSRERSVIPEALCRHIVDICEKK
jgi:hypothetical protein